MDCTQCGSEHTIKASKTRHGRTIWLCKNCGNKSTMKADVGGRPKIKKVCAVCGGKYYAKSLCKYHYGKNWRKKKITL